MVKMSKTTQIIYGIVCAIILVIIFVAILYAIVLFSNCETLYGYNPEGAHDVERFQSGTWAGHCYNIKAFAEAVLSFVGFELR